MMRRLLFALIVAGGAMGWSSAAPANTETTYINGKACCVKTGCYFRTASQKIECDTSKGTCCAIKVKSTSPANR